MILRTEGDKVIIDFAPKELNMGVLDNDASYIVLTKEQAEKLRVSLLVSKWEQNGRQL